MKVITANGTEFECEAITFNPSPPRLYFHLINTSVETVARVFSKELPIEGYPFFNTVQSISPEGSASVKVSLRGA